MPRFFLHIRSGSKLIEDEQGLDFADVSGAIHEAGRGARSLMSAEVVDGTLQLDQAIEIHDAQGRHVETVAFADALRIVSGEEGKQAADNDR